MKSYLGSTGRLSSANFFAFSENLALSECFSTLCQWISDWEIGSESTTGREKGEELDLKTPGGLVATVTEEGLTDASPSPNRGLPLVNRNIVINLPQIH